MKTLVLANQKGGVGKSAIATQFAHYLSHQGLRVLVIDLDHQQNTTRPLRAYATVHVAAITASALLEGQMLPELPDAGLVLVPGDDRLSMLEKQAERHNDFATNFRNALKAWDRFDVCIVDTNPNPDIRYASALISADFVLAPIQLNQEAIEGIAGLLGHARYGIARIKAALNPKLEFLGILPNLVEPTPFQRANLADLIRKFGPRLIADTSGPTTIYGLIQKRSVIAEAQAGGLFLPELKKTSARDTWREVKPVFDIILRRMNIKPALEVA